MWILLSLMTALSLAVSDALTKKALSSRDVYFVAWGKLVFALPLLLVCLTVSEIPSLDSTFWIVTLCALPLEMTALVLYTKALKVSPLSLTMPFLALTPLFLIVVSNVILGETVSFEGGIGILLMAAGSYTLNIHKARQNILGPLKAIVKEKGSVLMIIVSFIFSFTATLGKLAIEHSSPIFFGSIYFVLLTVLFTPIAIHKCSSSISINKRDILPLSAIGITYALMIVFHMTAISMVQVAYMVSIKRTSLLFSIVFGYYIFKEEKIAERAVGGSLMFAGFLLIVLS